MKMIGVDGMRGSAALQGGEGVTLGKAAGMEAVGHKHLDPALCAPMRAQYVWLEMFKYSWQRRGMEGGEYRKFLDKIPEWADAVVITSEGDVYPAVKSKYRRGQYYFSDKWKKIASGVDSGGRDVLVAEEWEGEVTLVRKGGRYIDIIPKRKTR